MAHMAIAPDRELNVALQIMQDSPIIRYECHTLNIPDGHIMGSVPGNVRLRLLDHMDFYPSRRNR
jgi:hypothetical protein